MDEDMPNGHHFDAEAGHARLTERVENQGSRINQLQLEMSRGFAQLNETINSLAKDFQQGNRTQWPVIWSAMGVCFAILFGIGGALYWPVREGQSEVKLDLRELTKAIALQFADTQAKTVSVNSFQDFRAAYENNRVISRTEYLDKFNRVDDDIEKINDKLVPRDELDRILEMYVQRATDLQRQITEIKADQTSTYGVRDVLMNVQADQKDLREKFLEMMRRADSQ